MVEVVKERINKSLEWLLVSDLRGAYISSIPHTHTHTHPHTPTHTHTHVAPVEHYRNNTVQLDKKMLGILLEFLGII